MERGTTVSTDASVTGRYIRGYRYSPLQPNAARRPEEGYTAGGAARALSDRGGRREPSSRSLVGTSSRARSSSRPDDRRSGTRSLDCCTHCERGLEPTKGRTEPAGRFWQRESLQRAEARPGTREVVAPLRQLVDAA